MVETFFQLGRIYGIDSLIEFLSVIVAFIISYQSYRIYKLIKNKEFRSFSLAFALIAIAFIFKILSNFTIYHYVEISDYHTTLRIISQFKYIELINFLSVIFYRLFVLLGLLILFFITTKTIKASKIFLFIYLGLLVIALSIYFPFIFYLTLVFILIFLTTYFYKNYQETKSNNSLLVFIGFLFFSISKLILIFSSNPILYLLGEIFLFLGFVSLLINQIKIKNEQKKKSLRSYKRYSRIASK
jgi:hypothetical protein